MAPDTRQREAAALADLPATELRARLARGEVRAVDLVGAFCDRIATSDGEVRAWAWHDRERVLREARAADALRASGLPAGALNGLPVGVKDIIDTAGIPTENGTPIDAGRVPRTDATVAARLRAAGAVIMGKTVTTELAFMHPAATTNPAAPGHTPGGSSSGSAAAVADFMVPVAYGTQTGGSVLRPAAFCGCVGYKPTFNLINRQGICFAAETLDTIGLLTRTVDDAELVTSVLINKPPSFLRLDSPPRLGLCRTPLWDTADDTTKHAVEDAAKRLAAAGASVKEIVLPEEFEKLYYTARETINNYERSKSMAADWQHHPDKISKVLGDRVKQGFAMKHEDYIAALQLADRCRARIDDAYDGIDAIISPCVKGEALKGLSYTGEPAFQQFWTVLNGPAMSLPTHTGPQGLPVGIQLVAPRYRDDQLFACARWVMERLAAV
jgi:Asp-tRNA(Asn)/Glu-tRNA(Gln) amidotransferase A subunit family amidase